MKWITWRKSTPWYRSAMRYSLYACISACAIFAVWHYGLADHNVSTVMVVTDSCLSRETREYLKSNPPSDCIKKITSIRKNRTQSALKFQAYMPLAAINTTQVVTQEGTVTGAHFYRPDIIERLPHIQVADALSMDDVSELIAWVSILPRSLQESMTIVWKNPTEIQLFFSKYPQTPVLVTTKTDLSPPRMNALEKLVAQDDLIMVDARFKNIFIGTQARGQRGTKRGRRS